MLQTPPDRRPASGSRRAQTKQRNRRLLMEAAIEVFQRQGLEGTTVRDIVGSTDLALGTFYNYFPDKETLFHTIVDEQIREVSQAIHTFCRQATDRTEFVRFAYEALLRTLAARQLQHGQAGFTDALMASFGRAPAYREAQALFMDDLSRAQELGWIPMADRHFLAASFLGIGLEVGRVMLRRPPVDPAAAARFASTLFVGGLDALARMPPSEDTLPG